MTRCRGLSFRLRLELAPLSASWQPLLPNSRVLEEEALRGSVVDSPAMLFDLRGGRFKPPFGSTGCWGGSGGAEGADGVKGFSSS